ncbi:MAG: hypothetical protein K2J15_02040 [Muribaculaceae bacterium]|nr:hypothetical protein [Muribaculaceae bacterium]
MKQLKQNILTADDSTNAPGKIEGKANTEIPLLEDSGKTTVKKAAPAKKTSSKKVAAKTAAKEKSTAKKTSK